MKQKVRTREWKLRTMRTSETRSEETHSDNSRVYRGWRGEAYQRIADLSEDLDYLTGDARPHLKKHLEDVGVVLRDTKASYRQWRSGGLVEEVWGDLHTVEERIGSVSRGALLQDYCGWAAEHARDGALAKDSRAFKEVDKAWAAVKDAAAKPAVGPTPPGDGGGGTEQVLAQNLACVLSHEHRIIGSRHRAVRELRNRLLDAAVVTFVLALLVSIAALLMPKLPILIDASKFPDATVGRLVALVGLGGLVGGALCALPVLTNTKADRYQLSYARAALRMSNGILAALLGIALVGAGWVTTLSADAPGALFTIAVAFGIAQETVTKVLEKKMSAVDAGTGSSNSVNTPE